MSCCCLPCSLSLAWGSLGELQSAEPCPSWQRAHSCSFTSGYSAGSKVTDKCFVKWMVVLQRLHIIKHKRRDEWGINGVILWLCMKESFGAVLGLCCEYLPGYCTHVILSLLLLSWPSVWDLRCVLSEIWTICFWGLFTTELSWPVVPRYILSLYGSCFKQCIGWIVYLRG